MTRGAASVGPPSPARLSPCPASGACAVISFIHSSPARRLESRDDAAAYLQSLRQRSHLPAAGEGAGITVAVDDSVTGRVSSYKQLASWGGFRRHFKGGAEDSPSAAGGPSDAAAADAGAAGAGAGGGAWRDHVKEQLLAKRAEVLETQRRLEALSLQQRELEILYTSALPLPPNP